MTQDAYGTLAEVVDDSVASLFVGRTGETEVFRGSCAAARQSPAALYVHGPVGVGKTALLSMWRRVAAQDGRIVVRADLRAIDCSEEALLQSLGGQVGVAGEAIAPSFGAVVTAVNRRAADSGVVILLDHYDEWIGWDAWMLKHVFPHLGRGVVLVLAGRTEPARLWSGHLGWRRAVRDVALKNLSESEVAEFLRAVHIQDPELVAEVWALSAGRPLLVAGAANALSLLAGAPAGGRPDGARADNDGDRLSLFLIEQLIHPASRRSAWRAGIGATALDRLVAAASLLPSFDRGVLGAMLGQRDVDTGWSALTALPIVHARQDGTYSYEIPEVLRRRIEQTVLWQRSWLSHRWRRLARAYRAAAATEWRPGGTVQAAVGTNGRLDERVDGPPTAETCITVAKEALMALHSPQRLLQSAAARHHASCVAEGPASAVRSWVLDALASSDFGQSTSGRTLLTLYYIDRVGSHEAVAERMGLARATYFRMHRSALRKLGASLLE